MATIDISGLDRAVVLAKLYNASRPVGLGVRQAQEGDLSVEVARALIDGRHPTGDTSRPRRTRFDYLFGRPLKIDLSKERLFVGAYDRDNGDGAASRALGLPMVTEPRGG